MTNLITQLYAKWQAYRAGKAQLQYARGYATAKAEITDRGAVAYDMFENGVDSSREFRTFDDFDRGVEAALLEYPQYKAKDNS